MRHVGGEASSNLGNESKSQEQEIQSVERKMGVREKNQTRGEEAGERTGMCNMRFLSARSEVQGGHEREKNQYGSDDAKEWEA